MKNIVTWYYKKEVRKGPLNLIRRKKHQKKRKPKYYQIILKNKKNLSNSLDGSKILKYIS